MKHHCVHIAGEISNIHIRRKLWVLEQAEVSKSQGATFRLCLKQCLMVDTLFAMDVSEVLWELSYKQLLRAICVFAPQQGTRIMKVTLRTWLCLAD